MKQYKVGDWIKIIKTGKYGSDNGEDLNPEQIGIVAPIINVRIGEWHENNKYHYELDTTTGLDVDDDEIKKATKKEIEKAKKKLMAEKL